MNAIVTLNIWTLDVSDSTLFNAGRRPKPRSSDFKCCGILEPREKAIRTGCESTRATCCSFHPPANLRFCLLFPTLVSVQHPPTICVGQETPLIAFRVYCVSILKIKYSIRATENDDHHRKGQSFRLLVDVIMIY